MVFVSANIRKISDYSIEVSLCSVKYSDLLFLEKKLYKYPTGEAAVRSLEML